MAFKVLLILIYIYTRNKYFNFKKSCPLNWTRVTKEKNNNNNEKKRPMFIKLFHKFEFIKVVCLLLYSYILSELVIKSRKLWYDCKS